MRLELASLEWVVQLTIYQLTGTIDVKQHGQNKQVLDKLKVERERGITGTFCGRVLLHC